MDVGDLEKIFKGILSAAEKLDAELLITSSRRTPPAVEARLEELLRGNPRCRLLVLVNRADAGGLKTTGEAVACIFELAHALVVSGDSISMVSEAAVSGKPVVSFAPRVVNGARPNTKDHRFLQRMNERGSIRLAEPEKVGEEIAQAFKAKSKKPALEASAQKRLVRPPLAEASDPVVEFLRKWL